MGSDPLHNYRTDEGSPIKSYISTRERSPWVVRVSGLASGGACGRRCPRPGLLLALLSRRPQHPLSSKALREPSPTPALRRQTSELGSPRRLVFPACPGLLKAEGAPGTQSAVPLSRESGGARPRRRPRPTRLPLGAPAGVPLRGPLDARPALGLQPAHSPCGARAPQPDDDLSPALPSRFPQQPWALTCPGPRVGRGSVRPARAKTPVGADAGEPRGRPTVLQRGSGQPRKAGFPPSLHQCIQLLVT